MTRRRGGARSVSHEKFIVFRDKAEEYYQTMKDAYDRNHYSACVANAVHCCICITDAFTVIRLGKKSAAQNHIEAVTLLKEARATDEAEKSRISDKLHELINMKTPAEYEDRKMSKAEAEKAKSLCEKIYLFLKYEIQRAEALPP
jgi:hypothetical protein